ncbi:MltR family transcriptional regulator [Pseudaeromonas sharmana]|uniref:MltR family transcriptional regulator n=1 Tax=Pseudaeromonas sharmana TaxID=328412 RepID=A0ABV8CRJ1_9GAMM
MHDLTKEDEILERLAGLDNPRGFFMETVSIVAEGVEQMLRRAFRQEEYAVKYAIEPLLNREGPLSELSVRLKLMLALGMLSATAYQDLELFIKLRDWLCDSRKDYRFSDEALFNRLTALCSLQAVGVPRLPNADAAGDALLYAMQRDRQDQMTRSALLLCVTRVVSELGKESPI